MSVGIDTDFLVALGILEHPKHRNSVELRDRLLESGDRFALAPQVVGEFIHVVTDARRFERPLSMDVALEMAGTWWQAEEVTPILPGPEAMRRFFSAMKDRQLGRKRILDTMLASTCLAAGVNRLVTGNPAHYRIFPELRLIGF